MLGRFYRLLSPAMTDFDCGKLCASDNGGIPACCEDETTYPVLYVDEFKWLRKKNRFWKRMPLRNRVARKLARDLHQNSLLAKCPGPAACNRSSRAIVCRIFPFEPHLDEEGRVQGLTFNFEMEDRCPLIGKPESLFNPVYIRNSIVFWKELLDLMPEEQDVYMNESARLRRQFARKGRKAPVFTGEKL